MVEMAQESFQLFFGADCLEFPFSEELLECLEFVLWKSKLHGSEVDLYTEKY
jgi:hypothetical protein